MIEITNNDKKLFYIAPLCKQNLQHVYHVDIHFSVVKWVWLYHNSLKIERERYSNINFSLIVSSIMIKCESYWYIDPVCCLGPISLLLILWSSPINLFSIERTTRVCYNHYRIDQVCVYSLYTFVTLLYFSLYTIVCTCATVRLLFRPSKTN